MHYGARGRLRALIPFGNMTDAFVDLRHQAQCCVRRCPGEADRDVHMLVNGPDSTSGQEPAPIVATPPVRQPGWRCDRKPVRAAGSAPPDGNVAWRPTGPPRPHPQINPCWCQTRTLPNQAKAKGMSGPDETSRNGRTGPATPNTSMCRFSV